MKNLFILLLLLSVLGCVKVEDEVVIPPQKKLDLNSTFVGKTTGFAHPDYFGGTATWTISHQGNEITADITYSNVTAKDFNGHTTADFNFDSKKFKGTIVNDTTLVGFMIFSGGQQIKENGKISKDGNSITCSTDSSDPFYRVVYVSFDLSRK